MPRRYIPERGDLVWCDFDPTLGHEQARQRPALVLSPKLFNQKVGLALVQVSKSRHSHLPIPMRR